jgi:hypothetical protein
MVAVAVVVVLLLEVRCLPSVVALLAGAQTRLRISTVSIRENRRRASSVQKVNIGNFGFAYSEPSRWDVANAKIPIHQEDLIHQPVGELGVLRGFARPGGLIVMVTTLNKDGD